MKYRKLFIIALAGLILTPILLINLPFARQQKVTSENTYKKSVEFLKKQLEELDPASSEAQAIYQTLAKIKAELSNNQHEAENPGAFLAAIRDVKTGLNGEVYAPNYKSRELEKARAFKNDQGMRTQALTWISRGPGNVSGRGRSMAVDPTDATGNTWFVATVGGGVWKTTDTGSTWALKTPALLTVSTTSIVIAPSNPDVMYLGTGMGYGRVVDLEGSGIYKSIDHGETWLQLASTADGELLEAINRIIIDPLDENRLLACSNNSYTSTGPNGGDRQSAIFKSDNGGTSWVQVFDPDNFFGSNTDNRVQQLIANPDNFDEMYATVNEVGVVKSIDGGDTWTVSADNFALPADIGQGEGSYSGISSRIEMAIAPGNTSKLYASVEHDSGTAELFMSKDAGASWVSVQNIGSELNWHNANGTPGPGVYNSGWFNHSIIVHPFNENILFVSGVDIFKITVDPISETRTIEAAAWWYAPNQHDVPSVHADNHFFVTIADASTESFRIVCANDGGVSYSADGGKNWTQINGMVSTQFYGVDKKPGESVYIGGLQDNGTYLSGLNPDESSSWKHVIGGDGFETAWNYRDPNLVLGASQRGNLRRSEDGGNSFQSVPEARGSGGPFISKIANVKTDPNLVFTVTLEGVNRSDNFGLNWQNMTLLPWIGYRPFSNVKISIANPQVVWASSRIVPDPYNATGGVHVSTDGGFNFVDITANLPPGLTEASGMATHPTLAGTAFLLFSAPDGAKVLRTDDYGATWNDISGFTTVTGRLSPTGFPDVAVFTLVVMPFDTNIIWAGTEIGLFISPDAGASWAIADNGFPAVSVFDMKIVDTEMVVATYGRGIWSAEIPELQTYNLPEPTLSPRLTGLAMHPSGDLKIGVELWSEFDSADVLLDNYVALRIYNNMAELDTAMFLDVVADSRVAAKILGYKGEFIYQSSTLFADVFLTTPQDSYVNFITGTADAEDFIGNGFEVKSQSGFATHAIHTEHPYPNGAILVYQLKTPIIVNAADPMMKYKDVALIEEGLVNNYLDANFYDYVIVEGSKDGITWEALAPGYDARFDAAWSSAYNNGTPGDASLYKEHTINLSNTFDDGEVIFIRFRLFADPVANGWGWTIDNIIIQQSDITGIADKTALRLHIYPNPAVEYLQVEFNAGEVEEFYIRSLAGKLLFAEQININQLSVQLDISGLKKSVYILQAKSASGITSHRFIKQ
jgi:hypothetical protein